MNPCIKALLAGVVSFLFTALGSSIVLIFKKVNKTILDIMLSFSAGIMLASSIFSLLIPSLEIVSKKTFIIVFIGILLGCFIIIIINKIFIKLSNKSSLLLIVSITVHNIPEGLAIGVAFGSAGSLIGAISLSLGIAIQNLPEGAAVSLPLKREGHSKIKAFLIGSFTAIVEPIFAIIGSLLALRIKYSLAFLLSFASGAMIYVVIKELIPESMAGDKKDLMGMVFMIGFLVMMVLDVLL